MVPAQSIEVPATTTPVIIISGRGVLVGWALRETTGVAATFAAIRDGQTSAGLMIAPVQIPSGGFSTMWMSDWGVAFSNGLRLGVSTGTIEGALWVIPQELIEAYGEQYAYATAPSTTGYPSLGIEGLE